MTAPIGISIVVPVADAAFLPQALRSLEAQRHPALEVLVEEQGGGTLAAALDRGFARAQGGILGWLNADDLLLPGAVERVATELAPGRGRDAVLGRALFFGEALGEGVVDHPAEYGGRCEHLAIWERGFDTVPQPSLFFTRTALERCGAFADLPRYALDYDFACRLERHCAIHRVDDRWSAVRVHAGSPLAHVTEAEVLEALIAVSRRHWGPWTAPLRWRLALSHARYEAHLHERARHHARLAEQARAEGRGGRAGLEIVKTWALSPAMARGRFGRK
jgi:hypothetical protein